MKITKEEYNYILRKRVQAARKAKDPQVQIDTVIKVNEFFDTVEENFTNMMDNLHSNIEKLPIGMTEKCTNILTKLEEEFYRRYSNAQNRLYEIENNLKGY